MANSERSEAVVADFKKRRLAHCALLRIHEMIDSFERDRVADLRMARIGIFVILSLLGSAACFFFASGRITLS